MEDSFIHIALLADLSEPIGPDAVTELGVVTYETAHALRDSSRKNGGITLDLFARQGSWRGLPLISLDPDEIGHPPAEPLAKFAVQESIYGQLWLSGMLQGYDLVHCLAPLVSPLQLMVAAGIPIVQTLTGAMTHPANWLSPRLLPRNMFRQVAMDRETGATLGIPTIEPCVDLARFTLTNAAIQHLAWDGSGGESAATAAQAIGERLGHPVRHVADLDASSLLERAGVLLHLSETLPTCGTPWALRALACGVPVAGWQEGLDSVVSESAIGALAPAGEWSVLADRILELPVRGEYALRRRQMVLARHGPTALAANYRKIYRDVLQALA